MLGTVVARVFSKSAHTVSLSEAELLCSLKQRKCGRKLSLGVSRHKCSVQSLEGIAE